MMNEFGNPLSGANVVGALTSKRTNFIRPGHFGHLPEKYSFALNPYSDVRFSRCPKCRNLTYLRKFALLVHLETVGLNVLGKTCRYCPNCELIIAHQRELEQELDRIVSVSTFKLTADSYLVIGTVKLSTWRKALLKPVPIEDILHQAADFKRYSQFHPEP